ILDVWFDSGVSHAAVLEHRPNLASPADMYLEGNDQHRGWFHSSLLESVGTRGRAPYLNVLTHGFVVDGEGKKMSKSVGNVIDSQTIIDEYGAEILRLWVASEDYTEDIRISSEILKRLVEAYRRIRNTSRFILGNLYDFKPDTDKTPYEEMAEMDRWILHRLQEVIRRVREAYEQYQFHMVYYTLYNFCTVDLSALYLDVLKDRLYTSKAASPARRSAQTAMKEVLEAMARLLAPILTFTAEEAWRYLPGARSESVHLERFPEEPVEWLDDTLAREWSRLLEVRREVARALETARARGLIGGGLEARVSIRSAPEDVPALLRAKRALLPTLFIVSQVDLEPDPAAAAVQHDSQEIPGLVIGVGRARGRKCQRCWVWSERVGESAAHPGLCERCLPVVLARPA
ncbi:MAG TPA: isoleucine--tRNA ligase, partial [Candidatus Rokubacteria bacterium]|nr:isoleucine--tRNA ligase [Candidatus Rokubacteria bacterium]